MSRVLDSLPFEGVEEPSTNDVILKVVSCSMYTLDNIRQGHCQGQGLEEAERP